MLQSSLLMKVAIDVHSLGTQAGGNETFYRQLLQGLVQDSSQIQYTLFHTSPRAPSLVEVDERFNWRQIPRNPVQRICFSLPSALRELKPDVFHCQYILPPGVKARTVITIHDLAHEHYPEFSPRMEGIRMRRLVPWSARRAGHIITDSAYSSADIAGTYGIPRGKITVAYLAAGAQFHPRDQQSCRVALKRSYGIGSPFILYVGRVQVRKNLVRLTEAYASVRSRYPDLKLVVVGKPDLHYEKLIARVEALGLKEHVIFPGYVPADDLPRFYNAAELFIFPSIFEGFGLPVMEAMASGVPTITSRGSCLAEVAGDGALLIDPMSVDSLAEAMTRVLESEDLRSDLVARGLRRSAYFSAKQFAGTILEVYKSLV